MDLSEVKVLDLFCGGGGASMGIFKTGINNITGVDIKEQFEYPFEFIKENVFNLSIDFLRDFDFIWSSPPCQYYCFYGGWKNKGYIYPDLIEKTRNLLLKTGKPFVIENIVSAPLRKDLFLCGTMFKLRVIRHRIFEIYGFNVEQPQHYKHIKNRKYFSVAGKGKTKYDTIENWQNAIGVDWIFVRKTLSQCVPPRYSKYIFKYFLKLKNIASNLRKF